MTDPALYQQLCIASQNPASQASESLPTPSSTSPAISVKSGSRHASATKGPTDSPEAVSPSRKRSREETEERQLASAEPNLGAGGAEGDAMEVDQEVDQEVLEAPRVATPTRAGSRAPSTGLYQQSGPSPKRIVPPVVSLSARSSVASYLTLPGHTASLPSPGLAWKRESRSPSASPQPRPRGRLPPCDTATGLHATAE